MSKSPSASSAPPAGQTLLAEVRYSLPDMLEELKAERAAGSFAMERLDPTEIKKLFKAKAKAGRGKSKK
jgi:hypothetical protein